MMNTEPRYSVHREKEKIVLGGVFTEAASGELTDAYHATDTSSVPVLDFSEIEHIDISGINALIKLMLRAGAQGRRLAATGLSQRLRDIFQATRIDEVFCSEPDSAGQVMSLYDPGKMAAWARPIERIMLSEIPEGAINMNVDGRKVVGPLQGFGRLWEKIFRIRLTGVNASPEEVIKAFKEHFPSFQPPQNRFFPTKAGIAPGEVVLINAHTPAGFICSGVWVVYADRETFTLMTPQGHPESGWVSFSAFEEHGCTVAQIGAFARTSDPLYEIGFNVMGSREHERIWTHVLESLAGHFGVPGWVRMDKSCVGDRLQWDRVGNIWYNAQIRTMLSCVKRHSHKGT